jgi:hypothetical protein
MDAIKFRAGVSLGLQVGHWMHTMLTVSRDVRHEMTLETTLA